MSNNTQTHKLKKFTFMLSDYVGYTPSDWDYLYDEDRYWELNYKVLAENNIDALNKLMEDSKRKIISETNVEITETFINYDFAEPFEDSLTSEYQIVSSEDARKGIDYFDKDITLIDKKICTSDWADGEQKTETYTFSDDVKIIKMRKSAPGWREYEISIHTEKHSCILQSHGEDIYNKGDCDIYQIQKQRLSLI